MTATATSAAPPRSTPVGERQDSPRPFVPEELSPGQAVQELESGTRLPRPLFHRIYERTPERFKAELIDGVVYVASPVYRGHGRPHLRLGWVLLNYEDATPGVEVADNVTTILGPRSEPQPDLYLRVRSDHGGQSATANVQRGETTPAGEDGDVVDGPPEFILEVSLSSRTRDLGLKRDDYARCGVLEYVVADLRNQRLHWFDLAGDEELDLADDGILRAHRFPGLWLDRDAAFRNDGKRLQATLARGLATPEHAAFVSRLAAAKAGNPDDAPDGGRAVPNKGTPGAEEPPA